MNDKEYIEFMSDQLQKHIKYREDLEKKKNNAGLIRGMSISRFFMDEFSRNLNESLKEDLPDFGSVRVCPKCGENQYRCEFTAPFKTYDEDQDNLIRGCIYCKFKWREKTVDNSEKKDQKEFILLWSDGSKSSIFTYESYKEAKHKWVGVRSHVNISKTKHVVLVTKPSMLDKWTWNEFIQAWV